MEGYVPLMAESMPSTLVTKHPIEDLLELSEEALADIIKSSCEVVIDGAMSEWGSKVETLFRKIEKSVLLWHEASIHQRIVLVFSEESA
jgi:hypothetical protein